MPATTLRSGVSIYAGDAQTVYKQSGSIMNALEANVSFEVM